MRRIITTLAALMALARLRMQELRLSSELISQSYLRLTACVVDDRNAVRSE
jgi:hypothetical protein